MKKKGTLVKRLFIYVFSLCMLSLYTTSCVSYDEDIDDIYKQLDELKTRIKAVEDQIATGKYIQEVQSISGGMKVTFNDGSSYSIVSGDKGDKGDPGATWSIGSEDGITWYWYKDGAKQQWQAVGKDGTDGKTAPSPEMYKKSEGQYYWIIFAWNEETKDFVPDTLDDRKGYEPLYSYNTYVVDRNAYYELHVWMEDLDTPANSAYKTIQLPKEAVANPFLEFLGYKRVKDPKSPISLAEIEDDITFFYWYLPGIRNATDGGDTSIWVGQKTVKQYQVLTTLERDSAAAIIRTNLPKTSWKLTLKDSQDGLLPISFGKPEKHTGSLTKASANDAIYILQMNGVQETFSSALDYEAKFKKAGGEGVVYSLMDTVTGINSGYKAFITPNPGNSTLPEAKLSTIGGNGETAVREYEVTVGDTLNMKFNDAAYLYDYYIEAADTVQAKKFGFTAYKANGTFKVTKTDPDEEKFKAVIYKLHYNGSFYKDTVTIKPLEILP
jgi:hypothetical protein